jgi:hypothetical protein
MEYGKIISRAVNVVWQNKFLILAGILAALGSGQFGGGGGGAGAGGDGSSGGSHPLDSELVGLAVGIGIAILCVLIVIAIVVWVVSTTARGGLIASVDAIESGQKSSFRQTWSAGWAKIRTLLGIGILPAIPAFLLFVAGFLGLAAFGALGGLYEALGSDFEEVAVAAGAGLGTVLAIVACCTAPIYFVLLILRNFAERACMLEDLGVIDSYRRGASVLMANLGQAIVLALLQIGIFIVLGILLFVPGLLIALCCILWPLLLAAQGFSEAFQSSLWTLAWREWTGRSTMEKAPAAA